jgi:hypothetical protein
VIIGLEPATVTKSQHRQGLPPHEISAERRLFAYAPACPLADLAAQNSQFWVAETGPMPGARHTAAVT